jgi:hypothetical protein
MLRCSSRLCGVPMRESSLACSSRSPLSSHRGAATALRDAAATYKADTDAIALKVKQEFAAKEKSKKEPKPRSSPTVKNRKAA